MMALIVCSISCTSAAKEAMYSSIEMNFDGIILGILLRTKLNKILTRIMPVKWVIIPGKAKDIVQDQEKTWY
jgi:hypothetical protein